MRFFRRFIGPMLVGCGMGFASLAPGRTLDSVAAVRGLGADEVAAGVPVALEATVTFSSPRFATLFVTDGLGESLSSRLPRPTRVA